MNVLRMNEESREKKKPEEEASTPEKCTLRGLVVTCK